MKIPAGTVRCGDFTRSADWAIVSNPWNATKKIPAARVIPATGPGDSGEPNFAARSGTRVSATAPTPTKRATRVILSAPTQGNRRMRAWGRVRAATNARNTTAARTFSDT